MKLAGFGCEGEAYSGSGECFHRALRERAGKLPLRGGGLGDEAAALPDLVKTGLEAHSFRSEQEAALPASVLLAAVQEGLGKPKHGGECPLGDNSSWILQ